MKLLSWNVNGLRSLASFPKTLAELDADIVCIQETRLAGASDPALEPLALIPGYSSYFSFCAARGGYSGVATFVRAGPLTPISAGEGLMDSTGGAAPTLDQVPEIGLKLLAAAFHGEEEGTDADGDGGNAGPVPTMTAETFEQVLDEGRVVITDHGRFVLINVYVPAVSVAGRSLFKLQFLLALLMKTSALQSIGRKVIIAGDFNICPTLRDIAERIPPSLLAVWHSSPKRIWLRHMLSTSGANLVDSFREMHPEARDAFTCWSEITRARENNFGVRIDLILVDRTLYHSDVRSAEVMANVPGSDHCPVAVTMEHPTFTDASLIREPPQFCAKNLPRFSKKQSKLFFRPISAPGKSESPTRARSALSAIDVLLPSAVAVAGENSRKRMRVAGPNGSISGPNGQRKQQKIGAFFRSRSQYKSDKLISENKSLAVVSVEQDVPQSSLLSRAGASTGNGTESAASNMNPAPSMQAVRKSVDIAIGEQEQASPTKKADAKEKWGLLFRGPPAAPKCRHGEPCKLKRVGKAGPNKGRTFWSCARAAGRRGDREANCNFFQWAPFAANKPLPD